MKILIIRIRASQGQIREMLEGLETYIKLAVDVERNILAGGASGIRGADQYSSTSGKPIDGN
jgi:hypothetical protein